MNKNIFIALLAFSGTVLADSYLCIPEAGAGVRKHRESRKVEGLVFNLDTKWIVTNEKKAGASYEGKWVVKPFGDYSPQPMECKTSLYNQNLSCLGGITNSTFNLYLDDSWGWEAGEYFYLRQGEDQRFFDIFVGTGRCSRI